MTKDTRSDSFTAAAFDEDGILASLPVFTIDRNYVIDRANAAAQALGSAVGEDWLGADIFQFCVEGHRDSLREVLLATLQGASIPKYEWVGPNKSAWLHTTPRRDIKGEITGIICVAQHRPDQYRAETERVAQDLTQLIDTANAPIIGIDADGLVNEWNQTAARITGYSKEEVLGQDLVENFITDEYKQSVGNVLDAALKGTEASNFEFPLYTKGGDRVQVLLNATTRRDAMGGITGVVGVGQDITELDQARSDLEAERVLLAARVDARTLELRKANFELERANRLKDEFLASMSHELRTPMNTVLGMSEALAEGAYGSLNEDQRLNLELIHESGTHLLSLINDILDLSKIEAGRLELDRSNVRITDLCESSIRIVRQAAASKDLEFSYHASLDVDTVEVDARRMKQALVNLLSNAVKFTPKGRAFGLMVSTTRDPNQKTSGELEFRVWDKGIGIPAEDIQKLFTPFRQLDSGLSREHNGTGLGLMITRQLVELHQGSVTLESDIGVGTTVTLRLPVRMKPISFDDQTTSPPGGEASSAEPPGALGARILLAEDNENNIRTYSGYLKRKGFEVDVAMDGSLAVEAALRNPPDLILMDIQMPKMDGLQATTELRKISGLDHVPIIALTALVMPGDRERCIAAGATAYLKKPVPLRKLLETIDRELLARRDDPNVE